MEPITVAFSQSVTDIGMIGRVDENNTRTIAFDCTQVLQQYPDAMIVCAYQRACDLKPYALSMSRTGDVFTATLGAGDLCVPGRVRMELRVLRGEDVLKSAIYMGRIAVSLRGEDDAPGTPTADVLNRLSQTLDDAIAATEEAKAIADRAEQAAKKAEDAADAAGSIVAGTLPIATAERLGGVKIGENLSITEDGTLSAQGGEITFESVVNAIGYTPANESTEDARPSNRIMDANGDVSFYLYNSQNISLVDYARTITKKGVYTCYVQKNCIDNPVEAADESLRGIFQINLTAVENGAMYAWFLLFDSNGRVYSRYTSARESTWNCLNSGGAAFETDETLSLDNGVLSVNRAQSVEQDNTLPITSAAVYQTVGNINALLGTI